MKQKQEQDDGNTAHHLYEAIASLKDTGEAEQFFQDLCSPAELQAMADRWQVVKLLQAGKPYREIYALTGVSVTTVGTSSQSPWS